MPTYAVLGATGNVGSKIVDVLLREPKNQLHLYVRSKAKLLKAQPELEASSKVTIYEGDLNDVELIKSCVSDTTAVFLSVALSENVPGTSIAFDTSSIVVDSLKRLHSENPSQQLPRLVVLSSSSTSEHFWKGIPSIVHSALFAANYYIYIDLQKAEKFLREQENWLRMTFVKPGGLSDDIAHGYKFDMDSSHTFMSFNDLAAAMVEIGETDDERWNMKQVGLVPKTTGARFELKAPYILGKGLAAYFFPWLYMSIRAWIP